MPTAVPGVAELVVDLRHPQAGPLAAMLEIMRAAASAAAVGRRCKAERGARSGGSSRSRSTSAWWPPREEAAGTDRVLASGALHDAAEMARHVPVAMVFAPSIGGLSHAKEEDTPEADLERAIDAFGRLA